MSYDLRPPSRELADVLWWFEYYLGCESHIYIYIKLLIGIFDKIIAS